MVPRSDWSLRECLLVALRKVVVTVGTVEPWGKLRLVVESVTGISCFLLPVLGAEGLCAGVAEGLLLREAVGEDLFFSAVAVDVFLF